MSTGNPTNVEKEVGHPRYKRRGIWDVDGDEEKILHAVTNEHRANPNPIAEPLIIQDIPHRLRQYWIRKSNPNGAIIVNRPSLSIHGWDVMGRLKKSLAGQFLKSCNAPMERIGGAEMRITVEESSPPFQMWGSKYRWLVSKDSPIPYKCNYG